MNVLTKIFATTTIIASLFGTNIAYADPAHDAYIAAMDLANAGKQSESQFKYYDAREFYRKSVIAFRQAIDTYGQIATAEAQSDKASAQNNINLLIERQKLLNDRYNENDNPIPDEPTYAQVLTDKAMAMTRATNEQYVAGNKAAACESAREATKLWTRAGAIYYETRDSQVSVSRTYTSNIEQSQANEKQVCEP